MSQDKFEKILSYQEKQKQGLSVYNTFSFIPYMEIDGVKYFNKEHIDKWVEANSMNQRTINTDKN